jgi:Histidine kinase-, DNA gyrase B-, and HSP90-like ATPase
MPSRQHRRPLLSAAMRACEEAGSALSRWTISARLVGCARDASFAMGKQKSAEPELGRVVVVRSGRLLLLSGRVPPFAHRDRRRGEPSGPAGPSCLWSDTRAFRRSGVAPLATSGCAERPGPTCALMRTRLAEERGVTIETSVEMTPATGSRALLLQLSTNLVYNAIVHNLPEQGTVWVSTSARPDVVELTVENTGEKLAPQMVSTLAEPFLRGDERVRADHAGVGLGLAIVERVAQAHDGTFTLAPRAAGGLGVTVQLPAAPPNTDS